jgi:hypothetical protein
VLKRSITEFKSCAVHPAALTWGDEALLLVSSPLFLKEGISKMTTTPDNKISTIDIKLAVDFGDMPPADAQRAADEIREAVASFGRPHIKVAYHATRHRFDPESKSRKVEVNSQTMGTTPIGEAIVAVLGSTWNT